MSCILNDAKMLNMLCVLYLGWYPVVAHPSYILLLKKIDDAALSFRFSLKPDLYPTLPTCNCAPLTGVCSCEFEAWVLKTKEAYRT